MDATKWAAKYDRAAQDLLGDEQVLACVAVARTGGWEALALMQVSGAAGLFSMMKGKKKAAGLPQQFLLAVTPERLYALALPKSSTGLKPRATKELARWERPAVDVSAEPVFNGTKIVIASPAEGERVECQGPKGELTDRVLAAAGALAVA